ncbi:methyltransferase [Capsulimonas corticalis]|uniref:Methyltransferase n=1 Tax=Capsulimonas corticalis TaxID=2219043 RepID=A0A402D2Z0_9BACT|nr:class I SAM-dependent methyltransferase [Capsulimonas corticalis]BDI28411.1 methyltransferase [Capsulimonas corticalis]
MLTNPQLLASDIVANRTMNRGRVLSGVNSYERELGFSPLERLRERRRAHGTAVWVDACCGEGRALLHAAALLRELELSDTISLIGVDLINTFPSHDFPNLTFVETDVTRYQPPSGADLITCIHGLHYLGDKLGFLENSYSALAEDGVFAGQLDPANVRSREEKWTWSAMLRRAKRGGADVTLRKNLLQMRGTGASLSFGLRYEGAKPSETPNYTGITVIDSWYASAPL